MIANNPIVRAGTRCSTYSLVEASTNEVWCPSDLGEEEAERGLLANHDASTGLWGHVSPTALNTPF